MEIGVRGFVAKSTTTLLFEFCFQGRSLKRALKELPEADGKSEAGVVAEALADYLGL